MTSWIGLPGALAEIACPVSEVTTLDRAVSDLVPFSGRRVVQLGRRVRRSWAIGYGVEHPRDFAVLDALTRWETPLVWVGALAQATNLLTPEQATLADATVYGGAGVLRGLILPGGTPVVQWAGGPTGSVVEVTGEGTVPVRSGVPVTVSAWTQRSGPNSTALRPRWLDAAGMLLSSTSISGPPGDSLQRASWTLTPPEGAASLVVAIAHAAVVALPQVTWTDSPVEWEPGRGVHRVVVIPGSESPIVAHRRQVLTDATYTIMEVG